MSLILPLILLGGGLVAISSADLPKNWKVCRSSDPQRAKCLKESAQIAYDTIMKGEKDLGVPSLDPLKVDKMTVRDSGSGKGPLTIVFNLSNFTQVGYKSGRVDNFKFDCKKPKITFDVTMKDDVSISGNYDGSGKVLLLPVHGKGGFKFIFRGYKLHGDISMSTVARKGVNYFKIDKFSLHITITGARTRLDNLFDGNKLLGDNMNKVFNEHWKPLSDELNPSLDKEFGKILEKYFKSIVERFPVTVFCPT